MTWLFGSKRRDADLSAFIPPNSQRGRFTSGTASKADALRVSAVWACLRLRADLLSTMPVQVFRDVGGVAAQVPKPPVLLHPSGGQMLMHEWLYSSQIDLDRYGNAFGQIAAWDGAGRPAQIELSPADEWTVTHNRLTGKIEYRRQGKLIPERDVWHEKQFTLPGVPVGLSPIAYAAWTLDQNLSAQQFALDWFTSEALPPVGTLKNERVAVVDADDAEVVKAKFKQTTANRDLFVTGKDWTYTPGEAAASDAKFLDTMQATSIDACRYMGVPADLIDAEAPKSSITYANISQRNLQFLILNLGPTIARRELTISDRLLPSPRYMKLNTAALLRMDEKTKVEMLSAAVAGRLVTPNEAREKLDRLPLTEADYQQFDRLFGAKPTPGMKQGVTND